MVRAIEADRDSTAAGTVGAVNDRVAKAVRANDPTVIEVAEMLRAIDFNTDDADVVVAEILRSNDLNMADAGLVIALINLPRERDMVCCGVVEAVNERTSCLTADTTGVVVATSVR